MNIRMVALMVFALLAGPALAELVTQVRAIELTAANMNVPTTGNGRLTYKPCAGPCDATYESARLTPETRYQVDDTATDFAGFRQAFFNLPRSEDHFALVSVDLDSGTVATLRIVKAERQD